MCTVNKFECIGKQSGRCTLLRCPYELCWILGSPRDYERGFCLVVHNTYIFCCLLHSGFFPGLILETEDGGCIAPQVSAPRLILSPTAELTNIQQRFIVMHLYTSQWHSSWAEGLFYLYFNTPNRFAR